VEEDLNIGKTGTMRTWLSRFYSRDDRRHADVMSTYNGYEVEMYEDGVQVRRQQCWEHTRQYAEDCAENWVERIIK
jgi:hypothetical protein